MSDVKKHSILAPSSASRWMACTPSALLAAKFGKDRGSTYADEGTLAHRLAELMLTDRLYARDGVRAPASAKAELDCVKANSLYYRGMDAEVGVYVEHAWDMLTKAGEKGSMFVELEVPLFYKLDDTGTVDNVVVNRENKTLYVTDLKFGQGVLVDAVENKQLLIYAISAMDELRNLCDFEHVVMTIVQPRRNRISSWELEVSSLEIARDMIMARAAKALKGEGGFKTGEHCRFCPVKARCRAVKDLAVSVAEKQFDDPALLTHAEIAKLLGQVDVIADWITSLKSYALEQALAGEKFEGYKLVAGNSRRTITDEKALLKALTDAGFEPTMFKRSKFVTLSELEKILTKAEFAEHCSAYVAKPEPAPVLAAASDPRAEFGVSQAAKDFKEFINE